MTKRFGSGNVHSAQTIFGVGELEIDMVARLNQMIVNQNTGHTGTVRIGDGGTMLGHTSRPMPAQQNFQSPALLRSMGSTRGQRAGANRGLPDTQPPHGAANPMINLLLPVAR